MAAKLVGVPAAQSPNAFMEAAEFILPESAIKGYISNGVQLCIPNDPCVNILHPGFETTRAILNKYKGDRDIGLRLAINLLASGKI